jgi:hypothetical protein
MFTFNAIPYSSVPLSDIKRRLIGGVRLQKPPFASDGMYGKICDNFIFLVLK